MQCLQAFSVKPGVNKLVPSDQFKKDLAGSPSDIQLAASKALKKLIENSSANSIRLHNLQGHKPTIWKIDVFPNKSWQISMRIENSHATLLRLATHKEMDSTY